MAGCVDEETVNVLCGIRIDEDSYRVNNNKLMLLEDFNTLASSNPQEYFKEMVDGNICYLYIKKQE